MQSTFDAVEREVLALPASVRHIIVMSGVPLVFPRVSATVTQPHLAPCAHIALGSPPRLRFCLLVRKQQSRIAGMYIFKKQPGCLYWWLQGQAAGDCWPRLVADAGTLLGYARLWLRLLQAWLD